MESFVSATDFHGDRHDADAYRGFRAFVRDFKPKFKVFTGDIWDFRALRSGASKEEKMHSMRADFKAGMDFLEWYQPKVITLGNHDQRLWDMVEKDGLRKSGPLVDYAEELIGKFEALAAKLDTRVLPYDKRKGIHGHKGLKFAHGFDGNSADAMAQTYGNVIFGHGHRIEHGFAASDEDRQAWMTGCLCQLDMSYNRGQVKTLAQQHGWAYGVFYGSNKFDVFQARMNGGVVTYAETLKQIKV